MPHTGGQPKPKVPRSSSTKSQPRAKGKGPGTKHEKYMRNPKGYKY